MREKNRIYFIFGRGVRRVATWLFKGNTKYIFNCGKCSAVCFWLVVCVLFYIPLNVILLSA